jgi:hypothetical protein
MILKDSYSDLYLKIYQAEIKKRGWSDCPWQWAGPSAHLTDCLPVRRGPSARVEGAWGGTGVSDANNGPSASGCRTVRAPRGLSAGSSRTVRACRVQVGPRSRGDKSTTLFSSSQTARALLHISLSFSLALSQGRTPLLGISIGALPGPSEHIPGLSARFSTMSSGYFFTYLTLSLSWILSKKVIRVS